MRYLFSVIRLACICCKRCRIWFWLRISINVISANTDWSMMFRNRNTYLNASFPASGRCRKISADQLWSQDNTGVANGGQDQQTDQQTFLFDVLPTQADTCPADVQLLFIWTDFLTIELAIIPIPPEYRPVKLFDHSVVDECWHHQTTITKSRLTRITHAPALTTWSSAIDLC